MASGRKRHTENGHGTAAKKTKTAGPKAAEPKAARTAEPSATLYVKNLNDKVMIDDLRTELYLQFSMCGHVVAINAHKSDKMRGQAHIAFANKESAAAALSRFNGNTFLGKPLEIYYAKQSSLRLQWLKTEVNSAAS